ncbi:hypothetical protein ACFV6U_06850 [Streptomyces sp. NPDC059810]|uniref:hypothetical protein n=1 Tax=Streptomyces sp. NPDC059810 TaxID=3346956 RepID=UPI0036466FBE
MMTKQSSDVAMTRIFAGTDIVPRAVADAIIAFTLQRGAAPGAVDRLVNGTGSPDHGSGHAQRPAGGAEQQDAEEGSSAQWGASLGELRAAAQLGGSSGKRADYWQERRDELDGELRQSEQVVAALKAQLAGVTGEATASEELRRQLSLLRAANLGLEAEAAAARRALEGPSRETTSEQAARELRGQLAALRRANQRLRIEVKRSNQTLQWEKEQWQARAEAAEKKTEALRDRLDSATDYVRLVDGDVAERDAVIEQQKRVRERLEADLERSRIEADALRAEVGRLGLRVLDLEEQLKSTVVSEPETAHTALLPPPASTRDTNRREDPRQRFGPPPRTTRPAAGVPARSDALDRTAWHPLRTPSPPPPPPSLWKECRDAFTPTWFLAGMTCLTALHTQTLGPALYTFHVMLSRGTLSSERAVLIWALGVVITLGVAYSAYRLIYRKNRVIGTLALAIITGCTALACNGNTTAITPVIAEYGKIHGEKWADRGDGKSCDEPDYCSPK